MNRCFQRILERIFVSGVLLLVAPVFALGQTDGDLVDFGRQIRPLLADKCFQCHGLDEELRETEFRMDTKQGLFEELDSGEQAIVPGVLEDSVIYQRLVSEDEDEHMPPLDFHKQMKPEEIDLIKKWIEQGAKWQQHWSLITPERPAVPELPDSAGVRNEIDNFVRAELIKANVAPASEADKVTLIRRLTIDLTGLPPTVAEVEHFVADNSKDAYETVVDRLLASPHYGEHMARFWLDAARYGDTHGLHLDNARTIWPYRDWVINAFNANMPFDQFTIEQLAGDLIPDATPEQIIATGFNRCNVTTSEGGALAEEYHVYYTIDRVATMSTVWMGLSMGCVTCHDHKFDPFQMDDFYSLYAFFNNLDGPVMDGNKELPAPIIQVAKPANRPKIKLLVAEVAQITAKRDARANDCAKDLNVWAAAFGSSNNTLAVTPTAGLVGHWPFDAEGEAVVNKVAPKSPGTLGQATRVDGRLGGAVQVTGEKFASLGDAANFDKSNAFSYGAWVQVRPNNGGGAVLARMNEADKHRGFDLYVSGEQVYAHLIHSWPGNAVKVQTKQKLELDKWQHLLVTYDGSGKAKGVKIYINGKSSPLTTNDDNLTETIKTDVPLHVGRRSTGSHFNGLVDEVRVYDRALDASEAAALSSGAELRAILATTVADRTDQQTATLKSYYLANHDAQHQKIVAELALVEQEKKKLEMDGRIESLVWRDKKELKPAHILLRGQYDKPGEEVQRRTPTALPPMPPEEDGKLPTRLSLAKWLMSEKHPLTSRVTVNRFWQQYFGAGIVTSAADFGSQGTAPSHPELLDWLAVDFRESGWDIKRLQKLIVMSATYRQSSRIPESMAVKDPENRLLARGPRYRADAEVIRDTILASSGLLVRKIGGPSVKPYQPPGIWKAVGYTDSNTANFKRDAGESLYRRSIYTFWKRTAPPPSMSTLDAPSRENCTVQRSRTNTPLAALALMNDEQFVEAARHLAQRTMLEGGRTDEEHATFAFQAATSRKPSPAELEIILDTFQVNLKKFEADRESATKLISVGESKRNVDLDASRLAAWTMIANMLLNLDETVTKG